MCRETRALLILNLDWITVRTRGVSRPSSPCSVCSVKGLERVRKREATCHCCLIEHHDVSCRLSLSRPGARRTYLLLSPPGRGSGSRSCLSVPPRSAAVQLENRYRWQLLWSFALNSPWHATYLYIRWMRAYVCTNHYELAHEHLKQAIASAQPPHARTSPS